MRAMTLHLDRWCTRCGEEVSVGDRVAWDPVHRGVLCLECAERR